MEREIFYRLVKDRTEDGEFVVQNADLFDHPFRVLITDVDVTFKNHATGKSHTKRCAWCQDLITMETVFLPLELLDTTE